MDHQNQIRAVDEQEDEDEAIEQVPCQTCWMGQVDERCTPLRGFLVPTDEAGRDPGLARWPESRPPRVGFGATHSRGCT